MDKVFAGKRVLITGAASGFGALAAQAFAAQGAELILCDVTPGPGHATVDVTQTDQMQAFHAQAGRIDIAINNAGIGQPLTTLQDTDCTLFDRVMAVNARGVFLGMKYQLATMIPARAGVIVNMASAAGLVGAGHMAAYAASKHAVVGLTRAAADEVARYGIRVNALCPAFAQTPLLQAMAADLPPERLTARIPMRRVADPAEIVQGLLWLCAPQNSFMTGQALAIDGGLTAI